MINKYYFLKFKIVKDVKFLINEHTMRPLIEIEI